MKPKLGKGANYYYQADQEPAISPNRMCYAIIAHVWSDTLVNLSVLLPSGEWVSKTRVPILGKDAKVENTGHVCKLEE